MKRVSNGLMYKFPNLRVAVVVLVSAMVGGCTPEINLFGGGDPASLYNLTPAGGSNASQPGVDWALFIDIPSAESALDTDRIAMRPSPNELRYFADVRWVDRAPRMLRSLLVQSFENSGRIRSVTGEVTGLPYDYSLKVELRAFHAEIADPRAAPRIKLRLNAKIIRRAPISLVATRNFELQETASGTDMAAIIDAYDGITRRMLRDVVSWTFATAGQ